MFTRSPCTGLLRFLKSSLPATAQKNRAWRITPPVPIRYNPASEPKGGPGFFTTLDRVYLMKRQKAKKKGKILRPPAPFTTTTPLRAAGLLTRRAIPRHGAEIAGSGAVGQETHRAKQQVAL